MEQSKLREDPYILQMEQSLNFIAFHPQLITDLNIDTTNDKSTRGRKICPITFDELTMDNAIIIGKTLYTTYGLRSFLQSHADVWLALNAHPIYCNISLLMQLKNPTTNVSFTVSEACAISEIILNKRPFQ
jgi:hypothetical protein